MRFGKIGPQGERAPVVFDGVALPFQRVERVAQAVVRVRRFRVDGDGALEQSHGFFQARLMPPDRRQPVQRGKVIRIVLENGGKQRGRLRQFSAGVKLRGLLEDDFPGI